MPLRLSTMSDAPDESRRLAAAVNRVFDLLEEQMCALPDSIAGALPGELVALIAATAMERAQSDGADDETCARMLVGLLQKVNDGAKVGVVAAAAVSRDRPPRTRVKRRPRRSAGR
jgi:hypothetical protein